MENEAPLAEGPIVENPAEMQHMDNETTDEDILESQVDLTEAYQDIVGAVDEIGELQITIDSGVESSDALEDVGDILADKLNEGDGITDTAVLATEIVIESIRIRLGFPKTFGQLPSLESFNNEGNRLESTRVALESTIKGTVKNIWESIVKFIKAVMSKIVMFITNLVNNYGRLEKHLTALKGKVEELPDETGASTKDLPVHPTLTKFFSHKGKADFDTVKHALDVVSKFDPIIQKGVKYFEKDVSFESLTKLDKTDFHKQVNEHMKELSSIFNPINDWVPGNQEITYEEISPGKLKFKYSDLTDTATILTPLSKQECLKILDLAIKEAKDGNKIRTFSDEVQRAMKSLISNIEKTSSRYDKNPAAAQDAVTDAGMPNFRETSHFFHSLADTMVFVLANLPQLHFKTLKHVGDYVTLTIIGNHRRNK